MPESKTIRVLYMEDDEGIAYLVSESLKKEGYAVETASNGEEGLLKYDQGNFDVLLVDYHMPVVGGLEVIQVLAAKGDPCPVIMITGSGDEMSAVKAMKLGSSDYIIKDTGAQFLKLLPSVIEEALKKKRLIEEKEKAQKEVKESRKMLQSVLDAIPVAVFWKDKNSRYLGSNIRAAKDAGLNSPEEIIGKDDYSLKWREQADSYREDDRIVIQSGKAKLDYEELITWQDGKKLWVRTSKVPLRNIEGNITGILGTYEDITNRKRVEEELLRYRNHLEELVEERTMELKRSQDILHHADKLSTLGKLVGSVAHEFNNPLFGVISLIENIEQSSSIEERKELSKMAKKECWRMADMIKNLQNFYKPSAGIVASVNVNKAIDEVLLIIGKDIKRKGIKIVKKYADNLAAVEAVEDQIKQVIINLLQNASDSISGIGGEIILTTEQTNSNVILKVQDTGEGIPKDSFKELFDPFFTTKGVKGTGLGLSVSYGIVKKHGGEITVDSKIGKGSTFTVTLPVHGVFQ